MVQGRFEATGIRPRFLDQVMAHGITFRPTCSGPTRSSTHEPDLDPSARSSSASSARSCSPPKCSSAGSRATAPEGKAINLRLKMIGRGREPRRSDEPAAPDGVRRFRKGCRRSSTGSARKLERMLMQAQVTMPTAAADADHLASRRSAIFFVLLLLMAAWWGIGDQLRPDRHQRDLCGACSARCLPLMVLNFKATRTRKKMQEQFPVALDVFVRGLRAGHPIAAALDLLTVEMPDPIGSQFGIAVDEVTYGAELRDALQSMAERWDLDDMRMFVVSLSVQSETGGNLAEILENLSQVIRERHSMMMKVRALSSEGRMTAMMLTDPADLHVRHAVPVQPALLPRCRQRSLVRPGLRVPDRPLPHRLFHHPQDGGFEGLSHA